MVGVTGFIEYSDLFKTVKPYRYIGPKKDFPDKNFTPVEKEIQVTDLRTLPDFKPTVDTHGFQVVSNVSKTLPELTDETNSEPYMNETAELVREITHSETLWPYNCRLRKAGGGNEKVPITCEAHIDVPQGGGWDRIRVNLTQEEQDLAIRGKIRVRALNTWRPMVNHAEDFPFAIIDPATLDYDEDLFNVDLCTPLGNGEVCLIKYKPTHKWYWVSNMTPDEILFFVQYDTHPPDGKPNFIPHSAFKNLDARPGCPPRQSVEARYYLVDPAPYEVEKPWGPLTRTDTRKQPWKDYVDDPHAKLAPPANASKRNMVFWYKKPESAPLPTEVK